MKNVDQADEFYSDRAQGLDEGNQVVISDCEIIEILELKGASLHRYFESASPG